MFFKFCRILNTTHENCVCVAFCMKALNISQGSLLKDNMPLKNEWLCIVFSLFQNIAPYRALILLQVLKLPADPNVVTILEGYVKNCAVNQLCGIGEKPQRRYRYHHYQSNKSRDLERACRRYRHTALSKIACPQKTVAVYENFVSVIVSVKILRYGKDVFK